ncbi:ferredoxin [Microbacterium sp. A94]|uniref:ferredoxin n=1 Tax=Microbacterium sp. A94 TaxID=3450717 RepID=UPI003F41DF11
MKIVVAREKCVGGGQCVVAAPDYFDLSDDDGLVVLLDDVVRPGSEINIDEAIVLCPAAAIALKTS